MTRCMGSLQALLKDKRNKRTNNKNRSRLSKLARSKKKNRNLQVRALMLTAAKYKTAARGNYMQN